MSTEMGKHFESAPLRVIRELAMHTPRAIVAQLERAMSRAARAVRKSLKLEDLGAEAEGRGAVHAMIICRRREAFP
jgi:hypothetical protein